MNNEDYINNEEQFTDSSFVESFIDRTNLTPAMRQYIEVKDQYPDCSILFRMGDFYETFYDDAVLISKVLDITLTKRGTKNPVPLAGIPYHALDNYLYKLIKAGIKVGIVEQLEDPKLAKGVVKRGLVRIITPGTIIDAVMLTEKQNNFIAAIMPNENRTEFGLAVSDLSTGEFLTTEINAEKLENELLRINPAEILIPQSLQNDHHPIIKNNKNNTQNKNNIKKTTYFINPYHERHFMFNAAYQLLTNNFKVLSLECFGIEDKRLSIEASGALLQYLKETQKTTLSHIRKINYYTTEQYMVLDKTTVQNLELIENIRDKTSNATLLGVLDKTLTPMGGRLLKQWLLHPLLNINEIQQRLSAVEEIVAHLILRKDLLEQLGNIHDLQRLISRINYGNANPRDLLALKNSLLIIPRLQVLLRERNSDLLRKIASITNFEQITALISNSINDDPPLSVREGNIIKKGYNLELDGLHDITRNGKKYIKELEEKEKARTTIKSLKVGFNNVFGYYIEVTRTNNHLVPENYIRKQTLANAERFITPELKEYEEKILGAEEKINMLEYDLFQQIIGKIVQRTAEIQDASQILAELDVIAGFAEIAVHNHYIMPQILPKDHFILNLENARHPVIEQLEETFIPNNVCLNKETRLMVITGPNMAGKSTVMRQVALITLMAQIGCFVPASEAKISVVDRIFTRVGAHDDLTHGQSTFMVEMNETASILNNATEYSLIIMDEIGRGTSTFDGVAIAWSVAEHIAKNIRAKTMFATHYHILTRLSEYSGVKNYNIAVKESEDTIIFLRKLVEGGTDKSYGVHAAKLAGMPFSVILRAKEIQADLEKEDTMHQDLDVNNDNN